MCLLILKLDVDIINDISLGVWVLLSKQNVAFCFDRQYTYLQISVIFSRLVFKFCYVWSRVAVTLLLRHDTSGIALNGLVFNEYSPLLLRGAQNIFQP